MNPPSLKEGGGRGVYAPPLNFAISKTIAALIIFAHFRSSWDHLGTILEHLGHLGPCWEHLGNVLAHLGPSWGYLGAILGTFWLLLFAASP